MINVRNQLVGSPFDKDVEIECNVEASPRSINYWIKDIKDGELNIYILLIIMFSDCIGKCLLHAIWKYEEKNQKNQEIQRLPFGDCDTNWSSVEIDIILVIH